MPTILFDVLKEIFVAWREGNRRVKLAIVVAVLLMLLGVLVAVGSDILLIRQPAMGTAGRDVGALIGGLGALIAFIIYGLQKSKEEVKREQKIEAVEKRVKDNP